MKLLAAAPEVQLLAPVPAPAPYLLQNNHEIRENEVKLYASIVAYYPPILMPKIEGKYISVSGYDFL